MIFLNNEEILLNDILKIPENEINDYKVKFNLYNGEKEFWAYLFLHKTWYINNNGKEE